MAEANQRPKRASGSERIRSPAVKSEDRSAENDKSDSEAETVIVDKPSSRGKPQRGSERLGSERRSSHGSATGLASPAALKMASVHGNDEAKKGSVLATREGSGDGGSAGVTRRSERATRGSKGPRKTRRSSDESDARSGSNSDGSSDGGSDIVARRRGSLRRARRQSSSSSSRREPRRSFPAHLELGEDGTPAYGQASHLSPSSFLPSPRLRSSHKRNASSALTTTEQQELSTMAPVTKVTDSSGQTVLHKTAKKGDEQKVRSILETATTEYINLADYAGNTAMQMAALKGNTVIIELLLKAHADPNTRNHDGDTPLQDAIDNGHDDVVALLKEYGAQEAPVRSTEASSKGSRPRFGYLYENANPTSLLKSIKAGDIERVGELLESKVKPDHECLLAAAGYSKEEAAEILVSVLLANGANPNPILEPEQKSYLQAAIDAGNNKVIKLLLDAGADPMVSIPGLHINFIDYCRNKRAPNWPDAVKILESRNTSRKGKERADTSPTAATTAPAMNLESWEENLKTSLNVSGLRLQSNPAMPQDASTNMPGLAAADSSDAPPTSVTPGATDAATAAATAQGRSAPIARMGSFPATTANTAAAVEEPVVVVPPVMRHLYGQPTPFRRPHNMRIEKGMHDFCPIYTVSVDGNVWMPNFYYALMRGCSMKDVRKYVKTVRPMPLEDRVEMFKRKPALVEQLGLAQNFREERGPEFPLCKAVGCPPKVIGKVTLYDFKQLHKEARETFMGLPDEWCFWHAARDVFEKFNVNVRKQFMANVWVDGEPRGVVDVEQLLMRT